jgi:hypothetical protein
VHFVLDFLRFLADLRDHNDRETDPPLIFDTDAVLALPIALQRLKPVAGQRRQIKARSWAVQASRPMSCPSSSTSER